MSAPPKLTLRNVAMAGSVWKSPPVRISCMMILKTTTPVPSLKRDSPSTMYLRSFGTLHSPKIARTATGSVVQISAPNRAAMRNDENMDSLNRKAAMKRVVISTPMVAKSETDRAWVRRRSSCMCSAPWNSSGGSSTKKTRSLLNPVP